MSDEQALLAAVRARPDDDLARGVYADWLDEHGRHDFAAGLRGPLGEAAVSFWVHFPGLPLSAALDTTRQFSQLLFGGHAAVKAAVTGFAESIQRALEAFSLLAITPGTPPAAAPRPGPGPSPGRPARTPSGC